MSHLVRVDFSRQTGDIKPMHGANLGPLQNISGGGKAGNDFTEFYREMGIPFCRLHDVEYPYGKNQFVDIHCIFPDFDADVNDPSSYNFKYTDFYLKGIIDAGSEVFYRLGESIDHFEKPLYIHPPKDYDKWAAVCEHIIAHYNEGWADGFSWGIRYWELWCEPDNDKLFTGTPAQFYELYRVTAVRLKARFGDTIRFGGYSASGFYARNRENPSRWFKSLLPFMKGFFDYITDEKTKAPMDFFSWHCYADTPEEVALHASYARELLDSYGLTDCESILDEFNFYYTFSEFGPYHKGVFADLAAALILSQKSSIDKMMHYCFGPRSTYNEMFASGFDNKHCRRYAGLESYSAFDTLYKLGKEVFTEGDVPQALDVLAATDGEKKAALFLCARKAFDDLEIQLDNIPCGTYTIKRVTDGEEGAAVMETASGTAADGERLRLSVKANETLLITFA